MSQDARTNDVEVQSTPRFVWWSTDESVHNGIPSALATLEVAIAVAVYWAIAIYFKTFTHLWVSICIAPLLLLRSDQSVALGLNWIRNYVQASPKGYARDRTIIHTGKFWIGSLVGLIAAALVSYVLARYWVAGHDGWVALGRGAVIGILSLSFGFAGTAAVAGAPVFTLLKGAVGSLVAGTAISIATAIAALGAGAEALATVGAVVGVAGLAAALGSESQVALIPGGAVAVWIRSLAIRFVATVRHLRSGFSDLPRNFVQNLFVVDFHHPAELVPEYRDEDFRSDGLIRKLQETQDVKEKFLYVIFFLICFVPAYVYRLSIKSTCWLYLPLAYIASERDLAFSPAHLLARLQRSPREWLRRLLALATLAGFIFTTLAASAGAKPPELLGAKFVSPLEFLFLLDIHSIKPWQVFNLLGAVITLYLFLAAGDIRIDRAYARNKQSQASLARKVQRLKILMRTRNVSSAILILILGIHALLLFSPLALYLPAFILSGLRWFYGEYMPGGL